MRYARLIDEVYSHADEYDLIVLDEVVSVYGYAMIDARNCASSCGASAVAASWY